MKITDFEIEKLPWPHLVDFLRLDSGADAEEGESDDSRDEDSWASPV